MRFDLLSLELFVVACEERSIVKAAARMNIATSAVSKRISNLETRLQTSLFIRNSKGLELTPVAYSLLHHARVLMRDLQQMKSEITQHADGVRGHIRIVASVSIIIQHLPHDLGEFLAHYPAVRIDLQEATSQGVVAAVAENSADIGVFGGVAPRDGLIFFPYCADRLIALVHTNHPLSTRKSVKFKDIAEYDLIGPGKGTFLESLVLRAAADVGHPLRMPVRVHGFETVSSMVEARLGIGLVPEKCAARYVVGGNLVVVALDEDWAVRQWNICVHEGRNAPPPVRLLLKHLTRSDAFSPPLV